MIEGFDEIGVSLEKKAEPVGEVEKLMIESEERERRWKIERMAHITSSTLKKLVTAGGKTKPWGDQAIKLILAAVHEKITGVERHQNNLRLALQWGNSYEPEAIEYYAIKTGQKVFDCSKDFDDIIFINNIIPGFGDSPDSFVNENGVQEFKCPYMGSTHLEYCGMDAIDDKFEYYWQLLGHILPPKIEWVDFISYDPRMPDDHELKMKIIRLCKKDHLINLEKLEKRINIAVKLIAKKDIKAILNINNYE